MKAAVLAFGFFGVQAVQAQTVVWSKKANGTNRSINSVAFRADGNKLLSGTNCQPASIRMFDTGSANLDWDYTVGSPFMCIMGVGFNSNSQYIAAIEEFGNVFVFNNTGSIPVIIDTIVTGTANAYSAVVSPVSDQVAVGCSNGHLKIYNLAGGTLSSDINAHTGMVSAIAYSADGSRIVTGGYDDKVKIWSSTGTLLFTCPGHTGDITGVKVTPDNTYVVSGSTDDKIKVWDLATGALVRTISGHTGDVKGIDLSPNGHHIASASQDATCRIWHLATGTELYSLSVPGNIPVTAVAWSPNGTQLVTGSLISDLVLWDLPTALGLHDAMSSANLAVSPNPAQDHLTIALPVDGQHWQLSLYNSVGQLQKQIADVSGSSAHIDVSGLPQGLFYGLLESKAQTAYFRFVVAR